MSLASAAQAQRVANRLGDALQDGRFDIGLLYRFEHVDQADFARHANASLLRTRLTYASGELSRTSLLLELDDLRNVGVGDFNSTRNDKTEWPIVADPEGVDVNQLLLAYRSRNGARIALGRQRLELPRRRFVASRNWRLNEQTFDALALAHTFASGFEGSYAFATNVNRIFGPDDGVPAAELGGRVHLFDGLRTIADGTELHAYGYFLDFDDAAALSSATLGLRVSGNRALGERLSVPFAIEYARQRDYADNPISYGADYVVLEAGLRFSGLSLLAGLERLEGNGRIGETMQTPLAGLNGLNGWADQFLVIPVDGLDDVVLRLDLPLGRAALNVSAHAFTANHGSARYGSELDVELSWPLAERYTLLFRVADYRADGHGADTVKSWLMLSANF